MKITSETAHLLSTPANTTQLLESIAQHKAGKVLIKSLNKNPEALSINLKKIRGVLPKNLKNKRMNINIRKRK